MGPNQDRFEPFVPLVSAEWDLEAPGSLWRQVEGSLVFVDISGFTSLSERLARKGRIGAEELTSVLNRVFGRMLEVAFERGGSLLKFGGDALLLFFASEDHVLQACAAGVEMRAALRDAAKESTSVGRIRLKMSSGIHTGKMDFFLVGESHRELIVGGSAASITTEMEGTADAGEIVISSAVEAQLPKDFIGARKGQGWILRKQKISHPPCGRIGRHLVTDGTRATRVPVRLREHLASGVMEPEHRIATIGFLKFEGVDALLAGEDPEHVGERLHRLVTVIQEAADREGVTFLATDIDAGGGKVILTAGVPASQPDDEGRMLRAGRQILDGNQDLAVRIGVNRGHVFAGNVGTAFRSTYTVMGDTVNLAARLMAAAQPGSLYASPSVLDRSSTLFRTEALEPFHVKGKAQPVRAYEVFEETGVREAETRRDLPFIGRDAELETIAGIVTTCTQDRGSGMVTVTGDTGIGKSRLVDEVVDHCPGLDTLMIQAEPNGMENPYWAFRDPLRRVLGIPRRSQSEMADALLAAVRRVVPGLKERAPLLGDVLHIEVPDTDETAAIDPQFRPDRTADALIELLSALYPGPVAILAEDGHWMDEASIRILRRIGDAAESRPWTVLFTARREGTDFEPIGEEVALAPLHDDAVRSIAIEATVAAPLRPHELEAVVERADGNPLFLSEILRVVRETGSADNLPETVDAVVSAEIDTLAPLTRQLLRYSSVLGRSFRRVVLDELLAPEPNQMDSATRKELARFIDADGDSRLRFRHAVVHDAAYQGLSFRRRRELHARAGDVIARLAGNDPDAVAEFLATHYSIAGIHDKAWRYTNVAAAKAKRAYANAEAVAHYGKAIEAAHHCPDVGSGDVASVWKALGEVQDLLGQYESARESFGRALRADRSDATRVADLYLRRAEAWFGSGHLTNAKRNVTLGRNQFGSVAEIDRVRAVAKLDAYESSIHAASGDPIRARAAATSAVEGALSVGEEEALARAYGVLDWANFAMGIDEPRRGEEAIEILQSLGLLERSVGVMNNLGAFAYLEGSWDEAVDWYRRAVETAERCGNVVEAARTRGNIGEVLIGQRRYEDAEPLIDEAERVYRSSSATQHLPFIRMQKARIALGAGEVGAAVQQLETLFEEQLASGDTSEDPEIVVHLADALVDAGHPDAAIERLDRFRMEAPEDAGEVSSGTGRVRGWALASIGESGAAIEALSSAVDTATGDGDFLGELLARELLVETRNRAGEDPDPIDAGRVVELTRQLGIASREPAWAALT